jgi:hypothetical protein
VVMFAGAGEKSSQSMDDALPSDASRDDMDSGSPSDSEPDSSCHNEIAPELKDSPGNILQ